MTRLSPTQISMYLRCPHQWYLRYVQKLKMPPAGAPLQGTVYHSVLAENFRQKIESGEDLGSDIIADLYDTEWVKTVEKNPSFPVSEIQWSKEETLGKAKDGGFLLVKKYHAEMAPSIVPEQVELRVSKPIMENLELLGVIDLVKTDKVVVDHKVASRKKSQVDADRDLQASSYCWLTGNLKFEFHQAIKGRPTKNFLIDNKVPPIKPDLNVVKTSRSEKQLNRVMKMIKETNELMKAGIYPARGDSFWCSKSYCGYWDVCKARYNVY